MPQDRGFLYNTLGAIEDHIIGAFLFMGAATTAIAIGGGYVSEMFSSYQKTQLEVAQIKAGIQLQTGDYNRNQLLDKFYVIDGNKVPVEVDGKSVDSILLEK